MRRSFPTNMHTFTSDSIFRSNGSNYQIGARRVSDSGYVSVDFDQTHILISDVSLMSADNMRRLQIDVARALSAALWRERVEAAEAENKTLAELEHFIKGVNAFTRDLRVPL